MWYDHVRTHQGLPILYDNWVDSLKKTVQGAELAYQFGGAKTDRASLVHRLGDAKLGIPRGGYGALFAGLNGSLLKFIPATAVQFMCYSQVRGAISLREYPL